MAEIIFNALITYTRPILIAALTDTFWKTPPSISAPVPLILVVIRGTKIAPAIVATITIFVINVARRIPFWPIIPERCCAGLIRTKSDDRDALFSHYAPLQTDAT